MRRTHAEAQDRKYHLQWGLQVLHWRSLPSLFSVPVFNFRGLENQLRALGSDKANAYRARTVHLIPFIRRRTHAEAQDRKYHLWTASTALALSAISLCQCSAFVDSKISFVPLAVAESLIIALNQCICFHL
jgi:hypothetical protein